MAASARTLRLVGLANCLVPAVLLTIYARTGALGANPVEFVLRATGTSALVFLLASLAVTPLRVSVGWKWLGKLRRMLGLTAFFYATVHLALYLGFDQLLDPLAIARDLLERPFIALGMVAYMLMIPLAVTSTTGWVKRLGGPTWRLLHRWVYPLSILAVLHFGLLVKADLRRPLFFGGVLGLLLGWRLLRGHAKIQQDGF
jgi:sulfoxide reductase heme-binding subunit YedZ